MRWFKHLSGAHRGRFSSRILEQFGPAGYSTWWIILELIGAEIDEKKRPRVTFELRIWSIFCKVSPVFFSKFIGFCEREGKLLVERHGKSITLECPNLLKYCDEYTRKLRTSSGQMSGQVSGGTPEQNRSRLEENRREESSSGAGAPEAPLPSLSEEERKAGAQTLKAALRAMDRKPDPQPAAKGKDNGNAYIDPDDPADVPLVEEARALGIPVGDRTPRAVLEQLVSRRTSKGEKY